MAVVRLRVSHGNRRPVGRDRGCVETGGISFWLCVLVVHHIRDYFRRVKRERDDADELEQQNGVQGSEVDSVDRLDDLSVGLRIYIPHSMNYTEFYI